MEPPGPSIASPSAEPASLRRAAGPTIRRMGVRAWISVAFLGLTSAVLSVWGLSWGMPGVTSWAPDTIAGTRTLRTMGMWPDRWPTHYPPLHFFINQLAYRPLLSRWEAQGTLTWARPSDGVSAPIPGRPGEPGVEPIFAPPVVDKIGRLIMVSRVLTVVMSVATVLATAACGARLFHDGRCGLGAGLTLATGAEWVYFSHLGNLDIPHMFWFSLSLYAYLRAWESDEWRHYALLGVFAALAVSTKDAVAGVYVGVGLVLIAVRAWRLRLGGGRPLRLLAAVAHPKIGLALASFALPYTIIQGLFISPHVYVSRMKYYLVGPGTRAFNKAYEGPVWLAREALSVAVKALGWPLFAVMLAATIYGLVRRPRRTGLLLVPCLAYYLVVCQYTGMVYARMLFPVYLCLALLVGRACADWLAWETVPRLVRFGSVALLYGSCIGYSAAVDLEMTHDTRYRAERWLRAHVKPDATLGVFSHPQYLPRFFVTGHRARPMPMTRRAILANRTDYLLLTSHNYEDFSDAAAACMADVRSGKMGYAPEPVARFSKRYLPPRRRWFAAAGWATRGAGKVSPDILILRRNR